MRRWATKDLEYLKENWGKYGVLKMAKDLNKSKEAIRRMRNILGLERAIEYTDYLNMSNVKELLGLNTLTPVKNFRDKYGLPLKKRPRLSPKYTLITMDELTKWLKEHQDLWDSKKLELYALGLEYDWLKEKRKQDKLKHYKEFRMWSDHEISLAKIMLSSGKDLSDISKRINRSEGSIRHKLNDLYRQQRGNMNVRKNMSCM